MYLNCFSTLILKKLVVKIQPNHLHYNGWIWCTLGIPYICPEFHRFSLRYMKNQFVFFFKLMCQVSEKELLFHSFIFCLLVFSFSHKNKLFLSVVDGKYIRYIVNAYFLNGIFFLFRRFQTISRLSMPNLTCEMFRGRFQRCKMRSWVVV